MTITLIKLNKADHDNQYDDDYNDYNDAGDGDGNGDVEEKGGGDHDKKVYSDAGVKKKWGR